MSIATLPMSEIKELDLNKTPIIFFDGVCAMCNSFVDLVLKADKEKIFHFAPIQGATAKELLPTLSDNPSDWSMIYLDENGVHDESDASLEIYRRLGGAWTILSLLLYIPKFIRNPIYRLIAKNRYKFFGKKDTCRLPTTEEQERFLP